MEDRRLSGDELDKILKRGHHNLSPGEFTALVGQSRRANELEDLLRKTWNALPTDLGEIGWYDQGEHTEEELDEIVELCSASRAAVGENFFLMNHKQIKVSVKDAGNP